MAANEGEPIRVGVIEDHPLYRYAVVNVLSAADGIEVGPVADSVPAFAAAQAPPGCVVVLDLKLRGITDSRAVAEVVRMGHKVLVVSAHAEPEAVLGAVSAGALGYLSKDAEGDDIVRAVREIAAGGSHISPALASYLLDSARPRTGVLSERERQVLSLVAAGERDADIAEAMSISVRTVRSYLDRIRDKTGRRRRSELTRLAIEEGMV